MDAYRFTDFSSEFEDLHISHPHVIRRESEVTYTDNYAHRELLSLNPELCRQILEGWSRSYYTLDYHMKGIKQYASPDIPKSRVNLDIYRKGERAIRKELSSLHPVRAFDVLVDLDKIPYKSSSAAGYDYIGAKGEIGGLNHKRAMSRARATIGSVVDEGIPGMIHAIKTAVPDVGYTRTQLSDLLDKPKVRAVWGRAFHYILIEGSSAAPLIEKFKEANTFYFMGADPIYSVPRLMSHVSSKCDWLYALDWKQFDATVSTFEINTAFDIIRDLLTFPNDHTRAAFCLSRQLFIHKKIAAPDGNTYWSHKGIPSGSYFTSIIGSIVNRLRIEYLWNSLLDHPPKLCFTLGDDSLVGDKELLHPRVIGELANTIGWYFNPEKTEYSRNAEDIKFLGRTYKGGFNTRDIKRCLRLLIYPEYPVEAGDISAYRAKSIFYDSGGLSDLLGRVASKLRQRYGLASEDRVPHYFRRYIM